LYLIFPLKYNINLYLVCNRLYEQHLYKMKIHSIGIFKQLALLYYRSTAFIYKALRTAYTAAVPWFKQRQQKTPESPLNSPQSAFDHLKIEGLPAYLEQIEKSSESLHCFFHLGKCLFIGFLEFLNISCPHENQHTVFIFL